MLAVRQAFLCDHFPMVTGSRELSPGEAGICTESRLLRETAETAGNSEIWRSEDLIDRVRGAMCTVAGKRMGVRLPSIAEPYRLRGPTW
jgi:hypothetical protein